MIHKINDAPRELREWRQLLGWRYETRHGKRTKVPVCPHTGVAGAVNDPATWGTYEQAEAARDIYKLDGLGFVFTSADPFCGVDLDRCRDPKSGEIDPWARTIIATLASYTEVSPSKRGFHIIVRGKLPPGGRKRGRIEMYDANRYFTLSGEHLEGTPTIIEERNHELRRLHRRLFARPMEATDGRRARQQSNGLSDQDVIGCAMRSKNGAEFAKLWRGQHDGHPSHSEADFALCSMLAFWTGGNPDAVDRLFRQSALYRGKWDVRHHSDGRTYGQATVDRALAGTMNLYRPTSHSLYRGGTWDDGSNGRSRLRSVRFNEIPDPGPRRYLLDGLVPESYPTLLHGDGGVAKSMLALSFGLAVALETGKVKWLGREVGEGGTVAYLDFELDGAEQRRRVNKLSRGLGLECVPDSFRYMSALGYPTREAFRAAREECREHGVKLLILDSLGPALQGDSEAARDVIGFFQRELEPFRAAGTTILAIDHQSRLQSGQHYQDKGAFGSVFKTNLARSVIQVEPTERGDGILALRLRQKKHNFGVLAEPFRAKLRFTDEQVTLEASELDAAELAEEQTLNATNRICLALESGPAYPGELAERTGLLPKTVSNTLTRLRKARQVEVTGEREGRSEQVRLRVSGPSRPQQVERGT